MATNAATARAFILKRVLKEYPHEAPSGLRVKDLAEATEGRQYAFNRRGYFFGFPDGSVLRFGFHPLSVYEREDIDNPAKPTRTVSFFVHSRFTAFSC